MDNIKINRDWRHQDEEKDKKPDNGGSGKSPDSPESPPSALKHPPNSGTPQGSKGGSPSSQQGGSNALANNNEDAENVRKDAIEKQNKKLASKSSYQKMQEAQNAQSMQKKALYKSKQEKIKEAKEQALSKQLQGTISDAEAKIKMRKILRQRERQDGLNLENGLSPMQLATKAQKQIQDGNPNFSTPADDMRHVGHSMKTVQEEFVKSKMYKEWSIAHNTMKINNNKNPSVFDPTTGLSKNYLKTVFGIFASKIAEEAIGWATIGDDEWDIDALVKRKYDKRPLSHCKQSRDKSVLVLLLDTSSSCSDQATFYSMIAQSAIAFGDIEIYDAPNMRIRAKWDKNGWSVVENQEMFHRDDIKGIDWGFRNRRIVAFSDYDGCDHIIYNSHFNKTYWFNRREIYNREKYMKRIMDGYGNPIPSMYNFTPLDFKGKTFKCDSALDFIKLVRKIK